MLMFILPAAHESKEKREVDESMEVIRVQQ